MFLYIPPVRGLPAAMNYPRAIGLRSICTCIQHLTITLHTMYIRNYYNTYPAISLHVCSQCRRIGTSTRITVV